MDRKNNSSNSNPAGASFSSYLSTAEESCVLKLAKLVHHHPPPHVITSSHQNTPSPISLERAKSAEGEISVFGAERYFNMKLDDYDPRNVDSNASKHGLKKDYRVDLQRAKPKSRPGTPSVSSEASWNSQTALLPSSHRNQAQNMEKKVNRRKIFSGFICSMSCADKKSIYVHKKIDHGEVHGKEVRKKAIQVDHNPVIFDGRRQSKPRFQAKDELRGQNFDRPNREEYFAFPISNSGVQNLIAKSQLEEEKTKEEDPRISLEVFGSHMMKKGDIAMNLQRKMSMLTWDAIPKSQNLSNTSETGGVNEDVESDASSDLFEIENLSGAEKPQFVRQASDGISSAMYEPSEASIEWSVVTASAADFSVNTGYDEKKLEESTKSPRITSKSKMAKEMQRSRPSGLLGCNSQKAVKVAETAYRTNQKLDSSMAVGKLMPDIKVKDFECP